MDSAKRSDPLSVLQLALSTLCFFGCLAAAALLMASAADPAGALLRSDSRLAVLTYAWAAGLMAVVMALSAWFAFRRVIGRPVHAGSSGGSFRLASVCLLAWPFVILAGRAMTESNLSPIWMPLLQILSLAIPFWWFYELGRRGLPPLSPQRSAGLAAVGLTLTPALLILLELAFGLIFLLVGMFSLAGSPDLALQLNELAAKLQSNPVDPAVFQDASRVLLGAPGVLFFLMVVVAGIIPVLEELVKPLGIWFTAGRPITPAMGWISGLISGAAFGMVESLGVSANFSGSEWASVTIQRTGSGLLHITTCALVGWGLACAWQQRNYLKLALSFTTAVALHCLWNVFGVLMGIVPLLGADLNTPIAASSLLAKSAPVVLVLFTTGMIAILARMNRMIRNEAEKDARDTVLSDEKFTSTQPPQF